MMYIIIIVEFISSISIRYNLAAWKKVFCVSRQKDLIQQQVLPAEALVAS
jgi:hypothetical protein